MAKSPLITDSTLDALYAKGFLSNDFYDRMKQEEEDKDKAFKEEAKQAEADFKKAQEEARLAQNIPANQNIATDATNTGRPPIVPVNAPFVPNDNSAMVQAPQVNRMIGPPPPPVPPQRVQPIPQENPGLLNKAWDWATGANQPQYNESGGQLKGANPAGEAIAKKVEEQNKKIEEDKKAAAPGSLASDQAKAAAAVSPTAPAAPAKPPELSDEMKRLLANLEATYGTQKLGLQELRDAAIQNSNQSSEVYKGALSEWEAKAAANDKANKEEYDYKMKMFNDLQNKMAQLQTTIKDPYANMSTGQKIVAAIGMFFGAGGTKKGGENPAVTQINKAIDRDIETQKANIEIGFRGLSAGRGLLGQYMEITDSRRVAENAAKLDMLQRAKFQLDDIASKSKGAEAQGHYDIAAGKLDERIAEQKLELQRQIEMAARAKGAGAGGDTLKSIRENNRYISEALEKAGIPSTENALSQAKDAIAGAADEGAMGALARGALDTAGKANPLAGAAAQSAYGSLYPKSLAAEQALQNLASEYLLMKTGKAATDEERRNAANTLFGDRSPAAIARGMNMVQMQLQARKNNIISGATEAGAAESSRRKSQEESAYPSLPFGKPGAAR